jgi:hypothetical protein
VRTLATSTPERISSRQRDMHEQLPDRLLQRTDAGILAVERQGRQAFGVPGVARLSHEIWLDVEGLPGCVVAGPEGDRARECFGSGSRLVHTFEASSTYDAMQLYNRDCVEGEWTTDYPEVDMAEYSDERAAIQRASLKR